MLKGSHLKFFNYDVVMSMHIVFFLSNSEDPVCQSTCIPVTRMKRVNPLYMGNSKLGVFTNSEDPCEMPHDAAFHMGLHCLLSSGALMKMFNYIL